jgi:hypothetical protein
MPVGLPYRSPPAPPEQRPSGLALPPGRMPLWRDGRPLKRWRYVGVYGTELMACFGVVAIGGLPQSFWAVWDRQARVLRERTRLRRGTVSLQHGRVRVRDRGVRIDLGFDEDEVDGVETISPHGGSYVWTRKRAGIAFAGIAVLDDAEHRLVAEGVVDDTAGYHARHTAWCWSAGVGATVDGTPVGWNLVDGVHDAPQASERTVWLAGRPTEVGPLRFGDALEEVAGLDGAWRLGFTAEAVREREDRFGPLRSRYEQPFGTFAGTLPGGVELAEGFGVMERHDARW